MDVDLSHHVSLSGGDVSDSNEQTLVGGEGCKTMISKYDPIEELSAAQPTTANNHHC
jgi:hypothetical protein